MADPVLTIHDDNGDVIPEGTPLTLATAIPGTPSAATEISVRNNAAAGDPVDDAKDVKLRVLARIAGSSGDWLTTGLQFLDQGSLQGRVTTVSGGATSPVVEWKPLSPDRFLALDKIPDGAIVTIELRISAPLSAALTDVEVVLSAETIQSTPLALGSYELFGNYVYLGRPGGVADPEFSEVLSITGAFSINGPPDADVNTPTAISYTLAGAEATFAPGSPSVTFSAVDGDSATLASGEAYYALLSLDGSASLSVTKGSKNTTPLQDSDKPTPPAGEIAACWVVVPFGLAIDTIDEVLELGHFGLTESGGLVVKIGGGRGAVGQRWVHTQTPTSVTLADNQTSKIWRQPESGLETLVSTASPTDPRSMLLWTVTTSAGVVTSTVDERRLGTSVLGTSGGSGVSAREDRMRSLFGADFPTTYDASKFEERTAVGQVALSTTAWRELTPYGASNAYPRLFTADSTFNLKVASTSSDDDDTGGTGAQELRAIYLDSSFNEVAVDVLMNGTTPAAVNASCLGLVAARVKDVGSGGEQAGDIGFAIDGGFTSGAPTGDYYGRILLGPAASPVPALSIPAGATSGLVIAVPTGKLAALSRLTFYSGGLAQVVVQAHRPTGPVTLWHGSVDAGSSPQVFEAPQWVESGGSAAAIPAETWVTVSAVSRVSNGQQIGAKLDWILYSAT